MKRSILLFHWVITLVMVLSVATLEGITGEVLDVTAFGATPDDAKDDTLAIQKALDISGEITLPKGVYLVHGLIRLKGETIIHGNGATFQSELDTNQSGRTSKNIMTLSGDKIVIDNLILDGGYSNGDAKAGGLVASLLHIYDAKSVLLNGVKSLNHASNWWEAFNYASLNEDHKKDMFSVIYIAFSKNITIVNMEQLKNIKTEGLLIYDSDKINLNHFESSHSPDIWSSLSILASDEIEMRDINVSDGALNQSGSSINFVANHHFVIKNTTTKNKQGFDISNEIMVKDTSLRIARDTSFGRFEDCYFQGQRALHGYPTIGSIEEVTFKNTHFVPTKKESYESWSARIEKAGRVVFDHCTFGSSSFKTYGIIMGESKEIKVVSSKFINPSIGIYLYGKHFNEVEIRENDFHGEDYTPIAFNWQGGGVVELFKLINNHFYGLLDKKSLYKVMGNFKIKKNIKQ